MKFEISRTLERQYSSFFETIFLISRFTQLFSVKNREKYEKCNNKHGFDVSVAVNSDANASDK
jgi:hypothetical protein